MLEHGDFSYRLPVKGRGTNEPVGYSMWHLLAARMMSENAMIAFIEEANEIGLNVLIDDLQEHMTVFPPHCRGLWLKHAPYRAGWSWPRFRALCAWKTPLDICQLTGLPLLPLAKEHRITRQLHPVLKAAHTASCQRIGLFLEDWWS